MLPVEDVKIREEYRYMILKGENGKKSSKFLRFSEKRREPGTYISRNLGEIVPKFEVLELPLACIWQQDIVCYNNHYHHRHRSKHDRSG